MYFVAGSEHIWKIVQEICVNTHLQQALYPRSVLDQQVRPFKGQKCCQFAFCDWTKFIDLLFQLCNDTCTI